MITVERKDSGIKNGLTNLAEAPDKHGDFRVVYHTSTSGDFSMLYVE
jgi:hypothetical protein